MALLLCASSVPVSATIPGDVNKNGVVDMGDAPLLYRYIIDNTSVALDSEQLAAADVAPLSGGVPQPDGVLDLGDVAVIHRAAAGVVALPRTLGNPATIANQQTWEPGAPYIVPQDLDVTGTGKLTLLPGTEVRFGAGGALIVQPGGELDGQGSGSEPVVLTADGPATPGAWAGLQLTSGGSGSGPVTVTLNEVEIRYADRGIDATGSKLAIVVSGGLVADFLTAGIELTASASATITGCTIDNTGARVGHGIKIEGATQGTTTVVGCTISGAARGIHLSNASPIIQGSSIDDNNRGIHIGHASDPIIDAGNVLTGNNYGIYIEGNGLNNDPDPTINGNQIHGNDTQDLLAKNYANPLLEIDAEDNWWGNANPIWIANQITDASDDPANQELTPWVRFIPFDNGSPDPDPGTYLWRTLPPGLTTLPAPTAELPGPHALVGRVTVPATASLVIEAGSTVDVGNTSELLVDGTLTIGGLDGSPVTIASAEVGPAAGDWEGIHLRPGSIGSTIDWAVIRHAERPLDAESAELTVRNTQVTEFAGSASDDAGIRFRAGGTGTVEDSVIDNGGSGGRGIAIVDSSAGPPPDPAIAILRNTIQGLADGILLLRAGVAPVLTHNNLSSNSNSNVRIQNVVNPTAALALDARRNYWGVTTAAGIRGTIDRSTPTGSAPVQVDFSHFLDATFPGGMEDPGLYAAFVLSNVARMAETFRPALGERVEIQFDLAAPTGVTFEVCEETDDDCSAVLHTASASFPEGTHSFFWDGKEDATGQVVADEAYSYVLTADDGVPDGVNEGRYNPARENGVPNGVAVEQLNSDFDAHANEFVHFEISLPVPGRISLRVASQDVLTDEPFPVGTDQLLVWNGRRVDESLVEGGENVLMWDRQKMKPNTVIVRGGVPEVLPSPPHVEVKADPYLVHHSYDQLAELTYRVDQQAYVTVMLLPPGITDPAATTEEIVLGTPDDLKSPGVDHTEEWWPRRESGDPDLVETATAGTFNFLIEARSVATGLTGSYLGTIQLRQ